MSLLLAIGFSVSSNASELYLTLKELHYTLCTRAKKSLPGREMRKKKTFMRIIKCSRNTPEQYWYVVEVILVAGHGLLSGSVSYTFLL